MTNAYATFGNEGTYNPTAFILSVADKNGNILESYNQNSNNVIPKNIADEINDILTDNVARTPLYGASSGLYFGSRPVADKTGTTNNYRDTWTIGYTPSYAVGVWSGNNDNTPINKQISGMIAVPMWNEFMTYLLKDKPVENFNKPDISLNNNILINQPPVKGVYCYSDTAGYHSYSILDTNDSQYTLWKIPEDNWINQNSCPF
jgi:membrane peptidoglycan carboxypeptidase